MSLPSSASSPCRSGLLMIAGQLDLSVGSVLPASSMTVADRLRPLPGADCRRHPRGSRARPSRRLHQRGARGPDESCPSFVVTLATLFAVAGLTLGLSVILTGSTSVALTSPPDRPKLLLGDYHRRQVPSDALLVDRGHRARRVHSELLDATATGFSRSVATA